MISSRKFTMDGGDIRMGISGKKEIVLSTQTFGLGYPDGYRPREHEVSFRWRGRKWVLSIETPEGHEAMWHNPEFSEPHPSCTPGTFWKHDPLNHKSRLYSIIVDVVELDRHSIENAVRSFLAAHEANQDTITFRWDSSWNAEEELASWGEEREHIIEWLRGGARPYTVVLHPQFIESMAEISEDTPEGTKESFIEEGFSEKPDGYLERKPGDVRDGLQEIFEGTLIELAEQLQDRGPLYLSSASWPLITFVADGERYNTAPIWERAGTRAWFGYLQSSKKVALLFSRTDHKLIDVGADPDFLSGLRCVRKS